MTGASGCSGQEPFDVASGKGIARARFSPGAGMRGAAGSRTAAGAARTILASTTTSVGPPIIIRCSTLSRRTSNRRRRASTVAYSMTASRGCRPRTAPLKRALPNRRTAQAAAPINPSTMRNARKKRTASGISAPNKSNIRPTPPSGCGGCADSQWLTAPVTFAAANTNTTLILTGDFEPGPRAISISMVNGGLMANVAGTFF